MRTTVGSAIHFRSFAAFAALTFLIGQAQAQDQIPETETPDAAEEEEEEATQTNADNDPDAEGNETPEEQSDDAVGQEMPADQASPPPASEREQTLHEKVSKLEAEVTSLKSAQEEAQMAALLAEEEVEVKQDVIQLYGFMDMGVQRLFGSELFEASFNANATTFVTGNINLYLDVNPHPDWRGLAELRFTNAPHGNINAVGSTLPGYESQFERESTQVFDPHATAANTYMWGGFTVIERAWIEWKRFQQFRIRVGNWFTPFGIWNVDHGQPTLIAATTPQFIQQLFLPLRQVGLQALGSFFMADWELAYRAWLSNGRNEIAVQDLTDDKAFGLRTFLRKETGDVRVQVGGSYHRGRVENKIINQSFSPTFEIDYDIDSSLAYLENVFGADLSLDVHDFRLRMEGTSRLVQYDEGKRLNAFGIGEADRWDMALYGLMAYRLPFWGLEPFVAAELMKNANPFGDVDGIMELAPGFNVHITPSITWKNQATRTWFFKYGGKAENYPYGDILSVVSRLVLAY